jgi:hypothetical protein
VALHRDARVTIDSALGWHLWATDLCLQAADDPQAGDAVILEVPLFHNSLNDFSLSRTYFASAYRLARKYPQVKRIDTLCSSIDRSSPPRALGFALQRIYRALRG